MIVGIAGKAFAGKDTFGMMLAEELNAIQNVPYIMMAYAYELKVRVQKDFDLSYDQLWGNKKEYMSVYPKRLHGFSSNPNDYWTPREIMQAYGEFYRSIDYNFWVKNLFKVISEKEYTNVIITDCRHLNEVSAVKEHNGFLIHITRENKDTPHGNTHISETALDDYNEYDLRVLNNWGFEELRVAAKEAAVVLNEFNKTDIEEKLSWQNQKA